MDVRIVQQRAQEFRVLAVESLYGGRGSTGGEREKRVSVIQTTASQNKESLRTRAIDRPEVLFVRLCHGGFQRFKAVCLHGNEKSKRVVAR